MNLFDQDMNITIVLLLFINIAGYIYSYLIVSNKVGSNKQIQPNSDRDLKYLKSHTPLFTVNVLTLVFFVFIGFFFFKEYIIDASTDLSIATILIQLFIILIFDDTFFYFLHRIFIIIFLLWNFLHC